MVKTKKVMSVLNLIITGIPSIHQDREPKNTMDLVLNLIITGIPSILIEVNPVNKEDEISFKPYYNWNTFNTTKY